ncbi:hypothetical protein [Thiorhodovibrio frisius]|uniref:hypothetical protein n=1 Tax=Thiorhodovibrio frisius TaxID=631362 RepID=UPI00022C774A|nr:hypothetical protein [Thiorhodovibrio frisius]WPL20231.1 Transposase [Thiorhodovibrio frisius]
MTDTYLLRCQRYIELNPVRADMVRDPGEYAWSSYRANGLGASDPLLSPHSLYLGLGETPESRQAAYRELFRTGLDEAALLELRLAIQQSQPIGSERFLQQIEQMTGQRREARPRGRPRLEPDGPLEKAGPRSHLWGMLYCVQRDRQGCRRAVYSTPRCPEDHARDIRRAVARCPHDEELQADGQ